MASQLTALEQKLDEIFVKNAPALPKKAVDIIVEYLPYLNLIIGLLTLSSAYWLWHWAHAANDLVNYANELSRTYGGGDVVADRMGFGIWLGLLVLLVEAVIYLAAFPGLRDRKKTGWNLLFYGLLINVVYGFVILFTSYGGVGSLIGSIIGSAIGGYFLFQIRDRYSAQPAVAEKAKTVKKSTKK
jgi:hypothetical protein